MCLCSQAGASSGALSALEADVAALKEQLAKKGAETRELQAAMSMLKLERAELEAAAKAAIQQAIAFETQVKELRARSAAAPATAAAAPAGKGRAVKSGSKGFGSLSAGKAEAVPAAAGASADATAELKALQEVRAQQRTWSQPRPFAYAAQLCCYRTHPRCIQPRQHASSLLKHPRGVSNSLTSTGPLQALAARESALQSATSTVSRLQSAIERSESELGAARGQLRSLKEAADAAAAVAAAEAGGKASLASELEAANQKVRLAQLAHALCVTDRCWLCGYGKGVGA